MLRMSYSEHFLSCVHLCVHPVTFSNDYPSEAAQPILLKFHRVSLSWGNERLLKWSWSIDQDDCHAHIWSKPLKSSSAEQRMHWGWICAQIIGYRRSTRVAKIMVVHWHLTFLRRGQVCFPMHLYAHHTFVWENVENFKRLLLWSLWANVTQISCGASWGQGMKDCQNSCGPLTKMATMPIYMYGKNL